MMILEYVESIFSMIVHYSIIFLEFAGVVVLMSTALKSIYAWCFKKGRVQLNLAQGIALALEFKLGGEVLRTVIVRERSELVILGAIILLRGALTLLIHWEIKGEEARMQERDS